MKPVLLRSLFLCTLVAVAAPPPAPCPDRLKADLEFLCSPALTGRETGTPGADQAAAYIAQQMQVAGLAPILPGGLGGVTPYHATWTYEGGVAFGPGPHRTFTTPLATAACNLVGIIPGQDPALRAEYVYITAHFDHLGQHEGDLYPGADDNASGTVALLEAARLLRGAHPRRTIAFLAVSGEEEGLLGSEAYLTTPPVPNGGILAAINLDMVGRGRPGELHVMPAQRDGDVSTLVQEARVIAEAQGMPLAAAIDGFWRQSDHYSFARRSIPSLCFNTGVHGDYHQPTDTPDKIDYPKLALTVAIVRELALRTANADAAPAQLPREVWEAWTWAPFSAHYLDPPPAAGQ